MPRRKPSPFSPFKDKCIFCGDSLPQSALQRKKSRKSKPLKWKKSPTGDGIRKRKMLVKKPTPYPIVRCRAPKIKPKNGMPMPTEANNQKRAATPACQPGKEDSRVMTTSQLGESELSPMLKGIVLGLRLGRQYNQELAGGEAPSFHLTPADVVQALAENQAQPSAHVSLSAGKPSFSGQKSVHTPTPSLVPSNRDMPPASAQQMKGISTSNSFQLQQEMEQFEPDPSAQLPEFSRQMDHYFNRCPMHIAMTTGRGNQPGCSIESINHSDIHTQTDSQWSIQLPVQPSSQSTLGSMLDLNSKSVLENNPEQGQNEALAQRSETCPNEEDTQMRDVDTT